jgi:hypothetical protein
VIAMNMKLKKILDDIQKTEEKISAWQEQLKQLNTQKKQMEDMEIIKSIRSMKLNSRELLLFLDGLQNGTMQLEKAASLETEKETENATDNKKDGVKGTSEREGTYEA